MRRRFPASYQARCDQWHQLNITDPSYSPPKKTPDGEAQMYLATLKKLWSEALFYSMFLGFFSSSHHWTSVILGPWKLIFIDYLFSIDLLLTKASIVDKIFDSYYYILRKNQTQNDYLWSVLYGTWTHTTSSRRGGWSEATASTAKPTLFSNEPTSTKIKVKCIMQIRLIYVKAYYI